MTQVVDHTCGHEICDHKGTYRTTACCSNCGWEGEMLHTLGHETGYGGQECPRCEADCVKPGEWIEGSKSA